MVAFGDGVTGNTADFGSADLGSIPSPRATLFMIEYWRDLCE